MNNPFLIVIGVIIVIGVGAFVLQQNNYLTPSSPQGVACTQEAKKCPDGSYVGRSGPNCEFAACPSISSGNPSPAPTPSPSPTPVPKPTLSCAQQVQAAQDSAIGKFCAQVATKFACPTTSYIYTARNACESSYLAEQGWYVVDPPPSGVQ